MFSSVCRTKLFFRVSMDLNNIVSTIQKLFMVYQWQRPQESRGGKERRIDLRLESGT